MPQNRRVLATRLFQRVAEDEQTGMVQTTAGRSLLISSLRQAKNVGGKPADPHQAAEGSYLRPRTERIANHIAQQVGKRSAVCMIMFGATAPRLIDYEPHGLANWEGPTS